MILNWRAVIPETPRVSSWLWFRIAALPLAVNPRGHLLCVLVLPM